MQVARTTIQIFQQSDEAQPFAAGTTIFEEGEAASVMYVVKSGEVSLEVGGRTLEALGPGDILGEMAMLIDGHRTATAIAKTDCELVPIDEDRFQFLVQQTPYFALDVMRIMAERIHAMNARA